MKRIVFFGLAAAFLALPINVAFSAQWTSKTSPNQRFGPKIGIDDLKNKKKNAQHPSDQRSKQWKIKKSS